MEKEPSETVALLMDAGREIDALRRVGQILLGQVEIVYLLNGIKPDDDRGVFDARKFELSDRIARHVIKLREEEEFRRNNTAAPAGNAAEGEMERDFRAYAERATEKAAAPVVQNEFNKQCNEVYDSGHREFGHGWKNVMALFHEIGGLNVSVLQAILEMKYPHRILYALSKDKDEASRIMLLPPLEMAVALGKIKGVMPKAAKRKHNIRGAGKKAPRRMQLRRAPKNAVLPVKQAMKESVARIRRKNKKG